MPSITVAGYVLVGLTAFMVLILLALVAALMRAGRASRHSLADGGESAMMSMAIQEAVGRLKAQERATAARAEASERLSTQIVAALTSGVIVVDLDERVRTMNPSARRILHLATEVEGRPFRDVLHQAPALADVIAETLRVGDPVLRRSISLGAGRRPSDLGVSVSPVADADGRFHAAVCLFTDLTSVVELEEQLRMKEALGRLGELTAGLAHEFRNGLATIHGYARLINPAALPEPNGPYMEAIRQETTALGEVVTNFLNFAKPEALALAPVDLRLVVDRAVDDAATAGGHIEVTGTFATVEGDEVLLRQALSNLLRNSVEASTEAGRSPLVQVVGEVDGGVQRVTIDDNGPGIAPAALARVFQPFVTTKPQGTGLGLAIVQKVIVSHNGRITADNNPDGGARFRIQLPLGPA